VRLCRTIGVDVAQPVDVVAAFPTSRAKRLIWQAGSAQSTTITFRLTDARKSSGLGAALGSAAGGAVEFTVYALSAELTGMEHTAFFIAHPRQFFSANAGGRIATGAHWGKLLVAN
jgi:hypothetical protein